MADGGGLIPTDHGFGVIPLGVILEPVGWASLYYNTAPASAYFVTNGVAATLAFSGPDPDAEQRAEQLLGERLGPHRFKLFQWTGALMRPSVVWPGIFYLIRRHGEPVQVVRRGQVIQRLCVVVSHREPDADRIMSILDLLETDETKLWEMANVLAPS